jgi:uncharacterized protein YwgA
LGSRGGEFRYRTRIHKIAFLIAQEFGLRIASFLPYHFGPWSPEVHDALAELAEEGLVRQRAAICEEIDGARGRRIRSASRGAASRRPVGPWR